MLHDGLERSSETTRNQVVVGARQSLHQGSRNTDDLISPSSTCLAFLRLASPSMSRLASLRGPSTPSPASSRSPPLSPTSPASKLSAFDPTPFHRKTRSIMTEVEKALKDWEDVVLVDGIRAGQGCIDARTELE